MDQYGDLTVFKMAAVRHVDFFKLKLFNGHSRGETLDFQKFEILTVAALKQVNLPHLAKFYQNRSSGH